MCACIWLVVHLLHLVRQPKGIVYDILSPYMIPTRSPLHYSSTHLGIFRALAFAFCEAVLLSQNQLLRYSQHQSLHGRILRMHADRTAVPVPVLVEAGCGTRIQVL